MKNRQATYVSVSAGGNDATCISSISVAWPDGSDAKVWLGDIGYGCADDIHGPWWQNSNNQTGSDPEQKSRCIWIDGDGTDGIQTEAIALHIADFGRTGNTVQSPDGTTTNAISKKWRDNRDLICKAVARMDFPTTTYSKDVYPLIYQPPLS